MQLKNDDDDVFELEEFNALTQDTVEEQSDESFDILAITVILATHQDHDLFLKFLQFIPINAQGMAGFIYKNLLKQEEQQHRFEQLYKQSGFFESSSSKYQEPQMVYNNTLN